MPPLPLLLVRCQAVQAENVTVLEGGTAEISCRLQNYDGSIVVIQNPRRQTLFFNGTRGERLRWQGAMDGEGVRRRWNWAKSPFRHRRS